MYHFPGCQIGGDSFSGRVTEAPFPRRSCANIEETCCILNLDLVLLQENSCQIEGATWPASRLRKLSQPSFLSQPNPQLELTIQSIKVICGLPAVQLP